MNILSIKIQITDKQTHYLNKIITKQSILNILGILFLQRNTEEIKIEKRDIEELK